MSLIPSAPFASRLFDIGALPSCERSAALRHDGKRKIVAIGTFVTRLQVIAVDCYYRAIGEVNKGPGDKCGCGVADDGKGGSYVESATDFAVNN
jgi:hypothetical protein